MEHSSLLHASICVLTITLFLGLFSGVLVAGRDSYLLDFNNCVMAFNSDVTFSQTPQKGVSSENHLVGFWSFNEGAGSTASDYSGNNNTGTLSIPAPLWVNGAYGKALDFDGLTNYVDCGSSADLSLAAPFTLMAWVYRSEKTNGTGQIITKDWNYKLFCNQNSKITFQFRDQTGNAWRSLTSNTTIPASWTLVSLTCESSGENTFVSMYFNNTLVASDLMLGTPSSSSASFRIGANQEGREHFAGSLDNICVYSNYVLSSSDLATICLMGPYAHPDPVSYANYYNLTNSVTGDTMLIYMSNILAGNNTPLVTCTSFFVNDRLTFTANDSAVVNVWTNLGKPTFTTGVWNADNCTTTLMLDSSSISELNWKTYTITTLTDVYSSVMPSNMTLDYSGCQTFSFNVSSGYRFDVSIDGVSLGQIYNYTFTNVTAPHIVNVSSTKLFTISASAGGNGSITPSGSVVINSGQFQTFTFTANEGYHVNKMLVDNASQNVTDSYTFNNVTKNHTIDVSFAINTYNITALTDEHSVIMPGNISVNYGEAQLFNITSDSGFVSHVYADDVDQGNLTSFNFANVQENHILSVISDPIVPIETSSTAPSPSASASLSSSPVASQTPQTSNSPLPLQTQQPTATPAADSSSFPTMTVLIAVAAVTAIVAFFGLSFKKGYITIETVDDADNSEAGSGQDKFKPVAYAGNYRSSYQMEKVMATLRLMDENITENAINTSGKTFSICVDGIYVKDSKILLLKRNVEPFKGYWHVAGGHVEENESLQDALKREFKEETGLDVKVGKIVGWRIEETPDRIKIILAFEVTSAEGEIKLNSEHTEFSWFNTIPLNSVYDYSKYLRKIV
ncbi:MAG: LamG-like jellyroll fold domain-containing protein [Candidatus Bathyarchaeia archaeon]